MEFADEFKELVQLDREQKIHWWESARFLSMRYANLMADQSPRYTKQPGQRAKDLRELLPNEMPGIAESYINAVLDSIDMPNTPHDCLAILLEWVNANTPLRETFPDLQFMRAYLLEQLDRLNESELVLHQIVKSFPAHQAALYRLAQIAEQQADIPAAEEFYSKCIEVSPGHYGSSEAVIRLASRNGKPTIDFQKRLLRTYPYNATYAYNVAMDLATNQSKSDGDEFYLQNKPYMPEAKFHSLRARMLLETDRKDEAIRYLDQNEPRVDDQLDYISCWVRIDYLVDKNEFPQAIELLEKMNEQWPYDSEIVDQLIRLKREINMLDAKLYARKLLSEGCHVFVVAYVFLQNESKAADSAIDILNQVPIDCRDAIAHQLVEAIQQTAEPHEQIALMKFCQERLPHLHEIRHTLAYTLRHCDRSEEAVTVAKSLLAEQPDNPQWLEVVGNCYEGYDNEKCLEYLEKSFEITGRADTLVQIGRNQADSSRIESEETFWEVLKLDPYNTVAMTNLFWVHNVRSPKLWSSIENALNANGAADIQCEYFLLTAKIVAEYLRQPLPDHWFKAAVYRAKEIAESGGFGDEPERLGVTLMQWWRCWRSDEQTLASGQEITRAANEKWIPNRPAGFTVAQATCLEEEDLESLFDYLTKMRGVDTETHDDEFPERISREVDEMEFAMQDARWDDAKIFANRAISMFDESIGTDSRLLVVQRLIDAENQGNLFDRLARMIPAELGARQLTQMTGCLIIAIGLLLYIKLQDWLGVSGQVALVGSVAPLLSIASGYFLIRNFKAGRRLKEIEQSDEVTNLAVGEDTETSATEPQSEFDTDAAEVVETEDKRELVNV